MQYDLIAQSPESTVVAEYTPEKRNSTAYQSEAALEQDFIARLQKQGYEYVSINSEEALKQNLRTQLEKLNAYTFTQGEWEQFYTKVIANAKESITEKTRKMQDDPVHVLTRDDGTSKNIKLIDKKDIHKNHVQVLNQYTEKGGTHESRYDVTILVNGLPLVHVELKRRGVAIREAFNQIARYQRESFWAGCGLYEYVQIFVISNGTHTKYYSNTTRHQHIKDMGTATGKRKPKTSHSFEFTSYWADANSMPIADLVDFTKTFFAKHTILAILTRYCVLTSENILLVMRPYQIAATERILNRIEISTTYKKMGTVEAGGYIWHTTGSGKTLTSFKTAQLATQLPYVDKVLFVVDRKDLDYQTMKEYDRFEKGAANSNTSTKILEKQLENDTCRIIITTIQKLSNFIHRHKKHDIYSKHLVLIFDECHRSQFGDMHVDIVKAFKKYHLFGFTGTPIFAKNAGAGKHFNLRTTAQAFGEKLHSYTIVNAIHDNNVLPFRIDYINTVKTPEHITDKQVSAIDREKALAAPQRVRHIVNYILEHFDQKTYRSQSGSHFEHGIITNVKKLAASKNNTVEESKQRRKVNGFNSIFAVASIPMAQQYYKAFQSQMQEKGKHLSIATIYSFAPNEVEDDTIFIDEDFDTNALDQGSREFLESAIADYNALFATNYDTSADKFQNYYKDVSMRMKNREIDLLIVVNMFLTGFDATTLNTLWVDKNLKQHGLIQSFSRTNRILNSVKTFGNIVCFRNLEQETNDALALFGNKDAKGIVLLKTFADYMNGFEQDEKHVAGYTELVEELKTHFPLGQEIVGEEAEKSFIQLFGALLRLRNILRSFDEFEGNELLLPREVQDYQSLYLDLHQKYKPNPKEKENINEDIVFEMELVKQVEVNIDYILMLVLKYHAGNCQDKTILVSIEKAINSSTELRSKKELIEGFIKEVTTNSDVDKDWKAFVQKQKETDLALIIANENLKSDAAQKFMENAFRDGVLKTTGTDIDAIIPPMSRFGGTGREEKRQNVVEKLVAFFEKYFGLR